MAKGKQIIAKELIPQRARVYGKDVMGTRKTETAVMLVLVTEDEHQEVYLSEEVADTLAEQLDAVLQANRGDEPAPQPGGLSPERLHKALQKHPAMFWTLAQYIGKLAGPWEDHGAGIYIRRNTTGETVALTSVSGDWASVRHGGGGHATNLAGSQAAADAFLTEQGYSTLL